MPTENEQPRSLEKLFVGSDISNLYIPLCQYFLVYLQLNKLLYIIQKNYEKIILERNRNVLDIIAYPVTAEDIDSIPAAF